MNFNRYSIYKRIILIVIFALLLVLVILCVNVRYKSYIYNSNVKYEKELSLLTAEELVKENIQCMNEHNQIKYALTLVPERRSGQNNINNIDWWRLNSIKEIDVDLEYRKTYMNVYDIKCFCVNYEVKWKKNPPYNDGKYSWTYIVIKPTENDRWYIATFGF